MTEKEKSQKDEPVVKVPSDKEKANQPITPVVHPAAGPFTEALTAKQYEDLKTDANKQATLNDEANKKHQEDIEKGRKEALDKFRKGKK